MTGDQVIRFTSAAVVCVVAAFAAVISYPHIYGLGRAHGQAGYGLLGALISACPTVAFIGTVEIAT